MLYVQRSATAILTDNPNKKKTLEKTQLMLKFLRETFTQIKNQKQKNYILNILLELILQ